MPDPPFVQGGPTQATVVLLERHVQGAVQAVLHTPVAARTSPADPRHPRADWLCNSTRCAACHGVRGVPCASGPSYAGPATRHGVGIPLSNAPPCPSMPAVSTVNGCSNAMKFRCTARDRPCILHRIPFTCSGCGPEWPNSRCCKTQSRASGPSLTWR